MSGVIFNNDGKFDFQLTKALIDERRLADVFEFGAIENPRFEVKSETWQWEQTGNICLEYRDAGRPSGIATTLADFWVHELKRDEATLVYLMFPIERLRELGRRAYRQGLRKDESGDGRRMSVVKLPLRDILW